MSGEIKLLLSDKSPIFIKGIIDILDKEKQLKVVGVCNSGTEVYSNAIKLEPDIILLDSEQCMYGRTNTIGDIHKSLPAANIIVLSCLESIEEFTRCIEAGAKAYISKNCSIESLIQTIKLVSDGEVIISPPLAVRVLEEFILLEKFKETAKLEDSDILTKREQAVISLASQGHTNKVIGITLRISEQTVKVHMRNILRKLHSHNRQQAIIAAKMLK